MPESQTSHVIKISVHDFFFEIPLYHEVKVSELEENIFGGEVDAYSSINHIDTTYTISDSYPSVLRIKDDSQYYSNSNLNSIPGGVVTISLDCKRKENDVLKYYVLIYNEGHSLQKIGQMPSLADMQFAELGKKYDKVLGKEDLKNLKKAIGLMAHGAGAGSFVYLRRIFENLIYETFRDHNTDLGINDADFKIKRMEDKVDFLSVYLPEQLVKMKKIYSILSVGVHELSEEDCLKYFPALKLSIELILDQKIEMENKRKKDELAQNQIGAILSELS